MVEKVLRGTAINPLEAAHYSQMYDGLKSISGEIFRASLELFSHCFMVKDAISQA